MIESSTFYFLQKLAENNHREWFHQHKQQHDAARENVLTFATQIRDELTKVDSAIPKNLDPKDCVMRIYRDIRFSNDKTPYKTNFGIAFSENGKNFVGPGYYLHIHPQESFLAGGCWMPESKILKAIRQEIDYHSDEFHSIINHPTFKKYFKELDQEYKLKTTPKGYSANHQAIEYLKLKSFTAQHTLSKNDLQKKDAAKQIVSGFNKLYSLIKFLRRSLA